MGFTQHGGLVVAPAAPSMIALQTDLAFREAITQGDLAIADSGWMVLFWRILRGEKLTRISGLKFFRCLLELPEAREAGNLFWVLPSETAKQKTLAWSQREGFPLTSDDLYVAPRYLEGRPPLATSEHSEGGCRPSLMPGDASIEMGRDRARPSIEDAKLLGIIGERRPKHIVIAIGGGMQDKIGNYIKQNCGYHPAFIASVLRPASSPEIRCAFRCGPIAFISAGFFGFSRNRELWVRDFGASADCPGSCFVTAANCRRRSDLRGQISAGQMSASPHCEIMLVSRSFSCTKKKHPRIPMKNPRTSRSVIGKHLIKSSPFFFASALLGVASWLVTGATGVAGPNLCDVCHKNSLTLTFACNSLDYRRHLDHGDPPHACTGTRINGKNDGSAAKANDGGGQ